MEANNIFLALDSCEKNKTGQLINDSFAYSPLNQAGNGDKPGCLSHEEIMGLIPRTDFMTSFKSELDRVIKQVEAAGTAQAKRARELQESHEAEKTTLEAKLREEEKALIEKDSVIRELQGGLPVKVQELENQLGIKEALLRSRDIELEGLRSKVNELTDQVAGLETAIAQAEAAGEAEAKRRREIEESHETEWARLETKLSEKENALLGQDSALRELEKRFTIRIGEFEAVITEKEALLQTRRIEAEGLQAKISSLTTHVTELEAVIDQMKAATASEAQRTEELKKRYTGLEAALRDTKERETSVARQLREGFDAKVRKLEGELQMKNQLLQRRESELKQKELLIKAKEEEADKFSESRARLIQKLTAELKEKKIALASYERSHWRSIGRRNWWKRMFPGRPLSLSAISGTSKHADNRERTGLLPLAARGSETPANSIKKSHSKREHQQQVTERESPLRPRKLVVLR
jgi:DNA repair exonuclease SbcCD ATPase subunit